MNRAAAVINTFNLGADEIDYIQMISLPVKIAINRLDLDALKNIRAYSSLRDSMPDNSNATLLGLLKWASNSASQGTLSSQIALATGWNEKQVTSLLSSRYLGMDQNSYKKFFTDLKELSKLGQAMAWISQTGLLKETLINSSFGHSQ